MLIAIQTITLSAQVPNSSFENWVTDSTKVPSHWNLLGDVVYENSGYQSNQSLKLTSNLATGTFGVFANTIIQEGISGGEPYAEKPITFQLYALYDMDSLNRAAVTAIFKSKGNIVGVAEIPIAGSSDNQWVLKSVPVQWFGFETPDSIIVIGASMDLENGSVQGDGFMQIDQLRFKTAGQTNQRVINDDFEQARVITSQRIAGWYTVDEYIKDLFGSALPYALVSKSSTAHSGAASVLLQNYANATDTTPGVMFTGTSFNYINKPAFKMDGRYTFLNGYYRYKPVNGDNAYILLTVYKNGVEMGRLEVKNLYPDSAWRPFSLAIGYYNSDMPDSAFLMIACSDPDNPKSADTKLWVDDVSFSNTYLSAESVSKSNMRIYPNPATRYVFIESGIQNAITTAVITDAAGKEYRNVSFAGTAAIDVSWFPAGLYYVYIYDRYNQIISNYKFIKH